MNDRNKIKIFLNNICDLLMIDEPKLIFSAYDGKAVKSVVKLDVDNNLEEFEIYLDIDNIKNSVFLFFALAHELRHCYQYYEVYCYRNEIENGLEPLEIVTQWEKEFNNYIPDGNDGFLKQLVEVDANAFALASLVVGFGVESDKILDAIVDNEKGKCFFKDEVFVRRYLEVLYEFQESLNETDGECKNIIIN